MKYREISGYSLINEVDEIKVTELANSIRTNGFVGCPILTFNGQLLTGSHRLAALRVLDLQDFDLDKFEVAEDVTELVNEAFESFNEENGYYPELDFSDIGWMLKDTWVEAYKEEIEEW